MRKYFVYGGLIASTLMIVFGIASISIGLSGRAEVRQDLTREHIVGTPDMTPKAITTEAAKAGVHGAPIPSCSVAGLTVNNGARAKCFASYMRIHALEATTGQTYAQMPMYIGKDGKPTEDKTAAAIDPQGKPVQNQARNTWVTETALATALNTSFFAEHVALFSVAMGVMLILVGSGFLVLTLAVLRPHDAVDDQRVSA